MERCPWCLGTEKMTRYHDEEWGVPLHDDRKQFEFLMLEAMQCGLSWNLMIEKREIFRGCFDGFDYDKIAAYTESDVQRILDTPGMIRSRRKVEAVIGNARAFQALRREFGSFSDWLWGFAQHKTILYDGHSQGRLPAGQRAVGCRSQGAEAPGIQIPGQHHGVFPFAGLRHYQRPSGGLLPLCGYFGALPGAALQPRSGTINNRMECGYHVQL